MSKKPAFVAYSVKQRAKGQKAIWTRIGAAWTHGKGTGLNVQLEAMPVDGHLVLIEPKDNSDTFEGASK